MAMIRSTGAIVFQRLVLRAILAGIFATAGCAGARIDVTAERSRYPISMSDAVHDVEGQLHGPSSLKRVGELSVEETRIGILYSLVTPRPTCDISDAVNTQVAAAKGEAVINLAVTVSEGCAFLNEFPVLNALPIWPGCVPVTITGDIVRRRSNAPRPQQSDPATVAAIP
jgi:hypothetical protein